MLRQQLVQRLRIVVREGVGEFAYRQRYAAMAGGGTDIPVLPAVISADRDAVAAGMGPARRMAPEVASEPFLPKRTMSAQGTRPTILSATSISIGCGREKITPLVQLSRDGRVDVGIVVAEGDGGQPVDEVDVFVAVGIPDPAARPWVMK